MGNILNNEILAQIVALAQECGKEKTTTENALISFVNRIERALELLQPLIGQLPIDKLQKLALHALVLPPKKSLQEMLHISDETMVTISSHATQTYNQKNYQDTACLCTLITLLTPKLFDGWLMLGHAEFYLTHYTGALIAYAMAVYANPNDSRPHHYSAFCYEMRREYDLALNAIDLALMIGSDDGHLTKRLEEYKKQLQKKRKLHAKSRI